MVLCCLFWRQSFVDVSPYVCSLYFDFGLGGGGGGGVGGRGHGYK